jgi:DNA replicative helicase MCM subunit Mcm2 (Cdc46/Mcm family)
MSDENGEVMEVPTTEAFTELCRKCEAQEEELQELRQWKDQFSDWQTSTVQQINAITEGLNSVQGGIQLYMAQVEQVLHGHNVRINVFEHILTDGDHEWLDAIREDFTGGKVIEKKELIKIGRDIVLPKIQREAEERMKEIKAEQEKAEREAGTQLVGPDGQPLGQSGGLVTPDGRQVVMDRVEEVEPGPDQED